MATVLQVLGVAFVALLAVVIIGYILLRILFWRVGRQLKDALSGMVALPPRITLGPEDELQWRDAALAESYLRPLPELGFTPAGLWSAREVPGLLISAWVHPSEAVTAVVYEHPAASPILDMVTRYVDGTSVTYTTTDQVGQLDPRPGHPNLSRPGLDTEALLRCALEERPEGEMVPAVAGDFKTHFERAYAEEMDWRSSRGGASEEEIRRIALASGNDYSDEVYAKALEAEEHQAMGNLNYALRERFAEETTLSVAEWERVSGALVFVHDRLKPDVLRDLLEAWFGENADAYVWREELPPRERFADVVAQIPEERRPEKLGEVAEPVPADVYTPNRGHVSDYDEEDER